MTSRPFGFGGLLTGRRAPADVEMPDGLPVSGGHGSPKIDAFLALQGQRLKDAFLAPSRALSGELPVYDPETGHTTDAAREAAGGLAGLAMTGGLGGVAAHAGETVLGAGPIRAYHGSPHNFDRFDISKLGTGEGAQAFGHGLYFAENEAVARGYRDALGGHVYDHPTLGRDLGGSDVNDLLLNYGREIGARDGDEFGLSMITRDATRRLHPNARAGLDQITAAQTDPAVRQIYERAREFKQRQLGHMYEVGIDADPAKMLDWDAPISQQSARVREYVGDRLSDANARGLVDVQTGRKVYEPFDPTGMDFYEGVGGLGTRTRSILAEDLAEAGIPGIRYFDRGSRDVSDGTRNYVTFSDDIVSILRKYGLAGLAALGAGAGGLGAPTDAQATPTPFGFGPSRRERIR